VVTRSTKRRLSISTDHRTVQYHLLRQFMTRRTTLSPNIPSAWGNNVYSLPYSCITYKVGWWYTGILGACGAGKVAILTFCYDYICVILS